ncbi:cellulose-binding domain-containing protein [Cellulomonas sp. zg-ZUI222]|uniref:Cellulose-binding domain-containing protein n=1 Tax=Cellulomonas wangleii TaxID=2816956 RepID=A0ABX8D8E5_9CELL|nr:DUF6055 domain-containing protein [Cellulomonas wangleii]MBO0922329.1 cellulose-binding domain-containing protein [Cellulomonas wangleii]MBO0926024.1 cellulose-binding domain-containing protein [Cellulomonas wangleii]QVI63318.1 cellulose-binding domain-containing protein [Cellulomonas wangleii]
MGPIRRGTVVVALVAAFVLGAALASALGDHGAERLRLAVPEPWRAAWSEAHVLEGDRVALAWGGRAGPDPTAAPDALRFDPDVVVAQLEALHALDVDEAGLGADEGPLAEHKLLVVVDGTWAQGPGAATPVDPPVTADEPSGDPVPPTRGAVVDGIALLRVQPAVLASSLEPEVAAAAVAGATASASAAATPSAAGPAPTDGAARSAGVPVPAGTPWELARGVAEALQHLTAAAHPGHGLTPESAATLRTAASAYLATLAVPGDHADVSDHLLAPHLAWGSARQGAAGWLLLQHLADRSSPRLVGDLWTGSSDTEHLLGAYVRLTSSNAAALNRRVTQYAMRVAVDDLTPGGLHQGVDPVLVAHRTTPVEAVADDPSHHRVTGTFAPGAYGYTVVRLVPDGSGTDVRVRVRGHVGSGAGEHPGWSFGLVAVGPGGPRYSPVTEATDGELRLALRAGEDEVYLVVTATPTEVVASGLETFPRTARYPYEFRVAGATVSDPVADLAAEGGHRHPHGGGWVDDTARVDPAAYVATGAVVRGDAVVGPGVRLEGRAWVEGGAELTGDVVVRDVARVLGSARLSGEVVLGGDAVVGFTCDAGAYTAYRPGAVCDPSAVDTDVNPVVPPFAPGETTLSDGLPTVTPSSGPTPEAGPEPSVTSPSRPAAATPPAAAPPSDGAQPGVAAPPAAVPAGACTATYEVVTSWPGGMQAQVTVTATTSGVRGWVLTWTQPDGLEITEQWAAEITRSGSTVTAENMPWNGIIEDGGSVTFGFNGTAASDTARSVPQVRCTRTG